MSISPEQVKAYRKGNSLTQPALAEMACVSVPTVKNWEKKGISDKQIKEAKTVLKIEKSKK